MENLLSSKKIRAAVRDHYKNRIGTGCSSQGSGRTSCCGGVPAAPGDLARLLGYSNQEMDSVPEGANLGLGCGNPQVLARLKAGETVLDLGSGAGFDCLLAARKVGAKGRVIGVDMTPEMVAKARENAAAAGLANVSFYQAEIEKLPLEDASVDVIISNCVVNLSPEKERVFKEAFRVLKPGGRMSIADVVALAPLPQALRQNLALISGCVGGAADVEGLRALLAGIGFSRVRIEVDQRSREFLNSWLPDTGLENYVASAQIQAVKPAGEVDFRASDCKDGAIGPRVE